MPGRNLFSDLTDFSVTPFLQNDIVFLQVGTSVVCLTLIYNTVIPRNLISMGVKKISPSGRYDKVSLRYYTRLLSIFFNKISLKRFYLVFSKLSILPIDVKQFYPQFFPNREYRPAVHPLV